MQIKVVLLLILISCCNPLLYGQDIRWVHQDTIVHDRLQDFKWWEAFIQSDTDITVKIDSLPNALKAFIVEAEERENISHFTQQKQLRLDAGNHHIFIFCSQLYPLRSTAGFYTIVNDRDTTQLHTLFSPELLEVDKHPTESFHLKVFPTVSSGLFKIDMQPLRNAEVLVYDTLRSVVHETDWSGRLLDLRGLDNGRYTIQVDDREFPVEIKDLTPAKVEHPKH